MNIAQIPTNNQRLGRLRPIRVMVIHTGETGEGTTAAEGMCAWAANPAAGGSFHIAVDTDSACRSVADRDTAFGAPGLNADGLHLELAGRAGHDLHHPHRTLAADRPIFVARFLRDHRIKE